MKSIHTKSLKVDSKIHDQIRILQKTGLIKESILDFTNNALREKLERFSRTEFNEQVTTALNQIQDELHRIEAKNESNLKKLKTKHKARTRTTKR